MTRDTRSNPRSDVVVAAIDARATLRASLEGFAREVRGRGVVILVDASRDGTADEADRLSVEGVRVVRRKPGSLTPELWRDGIAHSDADYLAFSTAQMVPPPSWLDALVGRLEETGAAGVGGPIEPARGLRPFDRAVYLQRYANYRAVIANARPPEPPGDNALYRREAIESLKDAWSAGFWESRVNRELRGRGERLEMTDHAALTFHGGSRAWPLARQRFRHARHYAADRASGMGPAERVARTAAAPAVPLVLLLRILRTVFSSREPLRPWLSSLPSLALLLTSWAAGEARGTWPGAGPHPRVVRTGSGVLRTSRRTQGETHS